MLRQLMNLKRYGRLRTSSPTPRIGVPRLLRDQPHLAISQVLEFVIAHHGRRADEFFFVQIGAFDGVTGDPLFELVKKYHWRGVLVEPQAEAFALLRKNYSQQTGLQFFNVAIGPEDGEVTFYTRPGGMVQPASMEMHLLIKPGHGKAELDARRVTCWTLKTLLQKANAPQHIDLLQIDAEGADYKIIRSIDFSSIQPTIIRYEHTVLSERERNACLSLLAEHGYRFLLEDRDTIAYRS